MKRKWLPIIFGTLLLASCGPSGESYSFTRQEDPGLGYFSTLKVAVGNALSQDNFGFESTDLAANAKIKSKGVASPLDKEYFLSMKGDSARWLINNVNGTFDDIDSLFEVKGLDFKCEELDIAAKNAGLVGFYEDGPDFYIDVTGLAKALFPHEEDDDPIEEEASLLPAKGKVVGESGSKIGSLVALFPFLLKGSLNETIDSLYEDYLENNSPYALSKKENLYSIEFSFMDEQFIESLIDKTIEVFFGPDLDADIQVGPITVNGKELKNEIDSFFKEAEIEDASFLVNFKEEGVEDFKFAFSLAFEDESLGLDLSESLNLYLTELSISGSFKALTENECKITFPDFSDFKELALFSPEE